MKKIEKSPLESKKFIAVMIWSICWLALTAYGIRTDLNADVLLAMIYINGMVQGMFLGGTILCRRHRSESYGYEWHCI